MLIGVWSNVLEKSFDFDLILKKTKWEHTVNKFCFSDKIWTKLQGASSQLEFIVRHQVIFKF